VEIRRFEEDDRAQVEALMDDFGDEIACRAKKPRIGARDQVLLRFRST
jgi:hypothetical protein